jgi:hypothetical protein
LALLETRVRRAAMAVEEALQAAKQNCGVATEKESSSKQEKLE